MQPTGGRWRLGHRPALDGLRGIAVLLVVAEHAGFMRGPGGVVGVTVFFVLSGFLITRVILEAREAGEWSYRGFIAARVVRLGPALVVMVATISALWVTSGRPPGQMATYAAAALLYVQNFAHPWLHDTVLVHTWSLAVEEQFYALWPLAIPFALRTRHPMRLLVATIVASATLRMLCAPWPMETLTFVGPVTNCYALLAGCLLAVQARQPPRIPAWGRGVAVVVLGALALYGNRGLIADTAALAYTIPAVGCAAVLIAGSGQRSLFLEAPPLRFLGRISYALYLWHWPLLWLSGVMGSGDHALAVLIVAVSLILATASTLLLEEPLRRAWRLRHRAKEDERQRRRVDVERPA